MSKKIYGDLNARKNSLSQSKNTIRDINTLTADNEGNVIYPYYKKEYIDKMFASMPISRVGSLNYLPLNVNGSFEGATTSASKKIMPVLLEDDGTLVYLRPGTNGSSEGYYYCYQENARNVSSMGSPVLTNTQYIPSFFTPNHTLINFVGTNAGQVLFMRTNNGTNDTYTIALTTGTLDHTQHSYVEFLRTRITGDPQYAMIMNDLIYIFCINSYNQAQPFGISVYTISTANVIAGSSSTLQKITGISGATMYGDATTNIDHIRLFDKYVSLVDTDKPMVVRNANISGLNLFQLYTDATIQAAGDGSQIRLLVSHVMTASTISTTINQPMWGFSLVFDTVTKTYTYDKDYVVPMTITSEEAVGTPIVFNNTLAYEMTSINGVATARQGNAPTLFQTNDGIMFSTVARYVTAPSHKVARGSITGFTNQFNSLNSTTRKLNNAINSDVSPQYGSALGENLINPTVLAKDKIMMYSSGTVNGVTYGFDSVTYTTLGSTRNYEYQSIQNGGTISGFSPQIDRKYLPNTNYQFAGMVTLVAANGTTRTFGSSFIEDVPNKISNGLLNPTSLTFDSTPYTLQDSGMLTALKNTIIESQTFTGNVVQSKIVFYYVPDSTFSKSIAITSLRTDDSTFNYGYLIVTEVDVSLSGNIITSLTPLTSYNNITGTNIIRINTSYLARAGGLTIAKYSDFTYIGASSIFNLGVITDDTFRSVLGKINNSTRRIEKVKPIGSYYLSSAAGTSSTGVLPTIGFGLFENGTVTDYQTKLVFKNYGTTSSQFDAMYDDLNSPPLERIVVASQDVAQGFVLYFTQEIPVLLGGKYHEMPITTIDLRTVTSSPANKTFYLYIKLIEGMARYVVSLTRLEEKIYQTYFGTVVTNGSGISSIVTEKVTRFLTYRPSSTQRGSAIPTSTGVPSSTGSRWHP